MSCSGHNFAETGRLRKKKKKKCNHIVSRTKLMRYIKADRGEKYHTKIYYLLKKTL